MTKQPGEMHDQESLLDERGARWQRRVDELFRQMTALAEKNVDLYGEVVQLRCELDAIHQTRASIELQLQALNEHALVSMTDLRGTIIFVNNAFCEISGYSRDELLGQNHRMLKSDEHDRAFFRDLWRTISSGGVWTGEIRNRRKDGTSYWVRATMMPVCDDEGTIVQYISVRTDVTSLKETEENTRRMAAQLELANLELDQRKREAEAKNRSLETANEALQLAQREASAATNAKSEFLANMSHEIRTPMTAILGFAEALADGVSAPENVEAVSIIRRNGEHLLEIINDILDLSKIEANRMTVEHIEFDPAPLAREVAELVRHRAEGKGLALRVEFDGAIPVTVRSDPTRLRQILINLLGNAIKFTEIGSVRLIVSLVTGTNVATRLRFDVLDTGIGMTERQMEQLFQPFSQADGSMTRRFGGTGLGLTISRRFAELLGGDVAVVESEPGVGTRFRVEIDPGAINDVAHIERTHAEIDATDAAGDARAAEVDLTGVRILLAEDGVDNQRLVSFVLRKGGATVEIVENGRDAVRAAMEALAAGTPFDCILMDMQMPILSGHDATTRLRDAGYTLPIIALTAHAMERDRQRCLDVGCDDYASKPVDRPTLFAAIRRCVDAHADPA